MTMRFAANVGICLQNFLVYAASVSFTEITRWFIFVDEYN